MAQINPNRVDISYENDIAHVRLTRADKMNAVDDDMIASVIAAGEEIADSDARACVISGEGRAFCAGTDISGLGAMAGQDPVALLEPRTHGDGTTNKWQEFAMVWTRVPIPVIAALHGPVYGAGFQLALGADIRIAAPDTKMAAMEMKWGMVPDMGGMVLMARIVRPDVMRRLTYTAQPVDADQALKWGLVTDVADEALGAAMDIASHIAGKSPSAIRAAKRLVTLSESGAGVAEILMAESSAQARLIGRPEQMEVIAAQMQKRPANFG